MKQTAVVMATEGTVFPYTGYVRSEKVTREVAVGPKCDLQTAGAWLCLTHPGLMAMTQLQKDAHLDRCLKPVLAWLCGAHGPEVP